MQDKSPGYIRLKEDAMHRAFLLARLYRDIQVPGSGSKFPKIILDMWTSYPKKHPIFLVSGFLSLDSASMFKYQV